MWETISFLRRPDTLWPFEGQPSSGHAVPTAAGLYTAVLDCVWNVMAHAQKPDFVFRRNGRVHLNRQGRQFSLLLAAEACALAVVMLDTPCSEVVSRVLATSSIRQFPLHVPSRVSPCAIAFQLDSTTGVLWMLRTVAGSQAASHSVTHNYKQHYAWRRYVPSDRRVVTSHDDDIWNLKFAYRT